MIEDVRKDLDRHGHATPAFKDKVKQDEFLGSVQLGLEACGRSSQADINRIAEAYQLIQQYLNQLSANLGALGPFERAVLDIAAEKSFRAKASDVPQADPSIADAQRYGRTDGASLLLRTEVDGFNTGFALDKFQEDCALLREAIKAVVASHPKRPEAKKYHLAQNTEQFIGFLGREWLRIFQERPSGNPGSVFADVLNKLLGYIDHLGSDDNNVGPRTLNPILKM